MSLIPSLSLTDWLILAITLVVLFYLYSTWTFSYWKKRGVPFVKPTPFFGNMGSPFSATLSLGETYQEIYKELNGKPYGGFFKFREPSLMVRDADLVKAVLVRDFSHFHDNDFYVNVKTDPMLGRNPFNLRGESWKTVRSQLTPAFTTAKMKPLFPMMDEVCESLKKYLETQRPGEDGLEAKELAAKFTTDVVASCVFGVNGNSFTDPNAQFREMGRRILQPSFWKNIQHTCIFMAPNLADMLGFKFFDDTVEKFFRQMVSESMSYREKNKVTRNDFLQLMMQLKAKGRLDGDVLNNHVHENFTDDDVVAHAATFFNDGFETSSTTLAFTLYELALNRDAMARLREEVDRALEKNSGQLNYEMVHEMKYLDMVLAESMRKFPAVTFMNRLCTKPYSIPAPDGGTVHVEKGTSVNIPIWALHHDPQYFPDPERFDPERFSEENKNAVHKGAYLPFSDGPRACLGTKFAYAQMKAGLSTIVANFDIEMSRRTQVPIVPDPQSFILCPKGGIWLKFSPRKQSTGR